MKSTTNIKGAMQVELPIKIYGYDIDVMGIVHNIVYIKWFEHLRQEYLDQYWPLEHMLQQNQSPILQKTQVEYKKPLTIYDKPTGILWVSQIKRVRWAVDIEIVQNGQIYCTGQQSGFFYDLKEKQPVLMPKALVNMYEEFQGGNQK